MPFDVPNLDAIGQARANMTNPAGASQYRPNVEDVDVATREAIRRLREQIDALHNQIGSLESQQTTMAATPPPAVTAPEYETATIRILYVGAFRIRSGYDAPEGRVQGTLGRDLWFQVSTTAASVLWVKATGSGFTGWQAINADASDFVDLLTNQVINGIKTFNDSPLVPTEVFGDNTTKAASTAFVQAAVAAAGGGTLISGTATVSFPTATAQEEDTAVETVPNIVITAAALKSASFIPQTSADHGSLDDFAWDGIRFYIENIVDNVSFDIRATATYASWGGFNVTYLIQV